MRQCFCNHILLKNGSWNSVIWKYNPLYVKSKQPVMMPVLDVSFSSFTEMDLASWNIVWLEADLWPGVLLIHSHVERKVLGSRLLPRKELPQIDWCVFKTPAVRDTPMSLWLLWNCTNKTDKRMTQSKQMRETQASGVFCFETRLTWRNNIIRPLCSFVFFLYVISPVSYKFSPVV